MDVFEAMKGRQSVRKFRKEPVPRQALLKMAEAASWAPSAGNVQNVRFVVVETRAPDEDEKDRHEVSPA
jgi:nitroreductase